MKILTADDAPDMLIMIRTIIQKLGHDVDTASDGLEAWDMLQKRSYDVVVSDWNMPFINGLELVADELRVRLQSAQRIVDLERKLLERSAQM